MSAIHAVLVNLEEQVRIYRRLTDLTRAQILALRARDVQAVHNILQDIELAMLERGKVERARTEMIAHVARELGIEPDDVDVHVVVQHSDPSVGQVIATVSAELRQLVADLDLLVAESQALLEQELNLIAIMVDSVTAREQTAGYARQGGRGIVRRNVLDAQV